jgi:hypothetical protein
MGRAAGRGWHRSGAAPGQAADRGGVAVDPRGGVRVVEDPLGGARSPIPAAVIAAAAGSLYRALTAAEDEESATLSKMSAQMVDALGRRRRGSA